MGYRLEVDVSLPILTIAHAHPAKTLGGFGLVGRRFTNCYHPADLSLTFESVAFTISASAGQGTRYGLTYVGL